MWVVFLFLLLPLPLSVHAKDLGELSANPARLSGSFGLFGLFGFSDFFGFPISQPNERDKPNKLDKPLLVSANKTDQIDQIHEIDQFRLPVLAGLGNPQYPWQFVAKSRSRVAKRARGVAKEGSVLFAVR